MTISLQEIRTAVQEYLDNKVTASISRPTPESGKLIGQNENFCFEITVKNAYRTNGGIKLKNVRYYLSTNDPNTAMLIVPPSSANQMTYLGPTFVTRSGNSLDTTTIPGTSVPLITTLTAGKMVQSMYLFPNSVNESCLEPGQTVTIGSKAYYKIGGNTLLGRSTKTATSGSKATINFKVYAEIDMDYLVPKNEDCPSALSDVQIDF